MSFSSFSNKIKKFTRMFCTSQQPSSYQQKQYTKKHKNNFNSNNNNNKNIKKMNIHKKTRNKFIFQNTLIKLSRKNIGQQQFFQNEILTFQLQNYLSQRINVNDNCITAIIKGQFTLQLYKNLIKPLVLRQKPFLSQKQNIICDAACIQGYCIKVPQRKESIDLVLFQLCDGQKNKKNKNEFSIVQDIFKSYHKKVKNFILICSKNIKMQQYTQLFKLYSHEYIFDIQRVMQNQNLICNIIWASPELNFLRIQKDSLIEFYIERLTLFKTQYRNTEIVQLFGKLIDLGLHLEMSRVLSDVQLVRNKIDDLLKAFVYQLYDKQERSRQIILEYFQIDQDCPQTPKLIDFTPGFKNTSNQKYFKEDDDTDF